MRSRTLRSMARSACAVVLAALALAGPLASAADAAPPPLWETDGSVSAIVESGGIVYIGGGFSYVGPHTGSGVVLSSESGAVVSRFPQVEGGRVSAAVRDGSGGWFIGGTFTSVGGVARGHLAHIRADGTLDTAWNPNADYWVLALAVSGSTVYAGGLFGRVGGRVRHHIAAIDARTGRVTAWNPDAWGTVTALAVSGSTVYAGGEFSRIGGRIRHRIAALDGQTGRATAWDPRANGQVFELVVSGSTVYAGGNFTRVGGKSRSYIAALDAETGKATALEPECEQLGARARGLGLDRLRRRDLQPHRRQEP